MAYKFTKLFPTPEHCQRGSLPGLADSAQGWFDYLNSLLAGLTQEERVGAKLYLTAERGIEVWYPRYISDAEINMAQEQLLFEALTMTALDQMTKEWRDALIARYRSLEQGDSFGVNP